MPQNYTWLVKIINFIYLTTVSFLNQDTNGKMLLISFCSSWFPSSLDLRDLSVLWNVLAVRGFWLLPAYCSEVRGANILLIFPQNIKVQNPSDSRSPHRMLWGTFSRGLQFSLLCFREWNCWSDGIYLLDLTRGCQSTLQNRVRAPGPRQGKVLPFCCGPANTCQSSLQVLARLPDAAWDLAASIASSPIIDELGHRSSFSAFQGSSPCEGPLHILCFPVHGVFLFDL